MSIENNYSLYLNQLINHPKKANRPHNIDDECIKALVKKALEGPKDNFGSIEFEHNNQLYAAYEKIKNGEKKLMILQYTGQEVGNGSEGIICEWVKISSGKSKVMKYSRAPNEISNLKEEYTHLNELKNHIKIGLQQAPEAFIYHTVLLPHSKHRTVVPAFIGKKYAYDGSKYIPTSLLEFKKQFAHLVKAVLDMHKVGYAHGDIKPANTLVNDRYERLNLVLYKRLNLVLSDLGGAIKVSSATPTPRVSTSYFFPYLDIIEIEKYQNDLPKLKEFLLKRDAFALGLTLFLIAVGKNSTKNKNIFFTSPEFLQTYSKHDCIKIEYNDLFLPLMAKELDQAKIDDQPLDKDLKEMILGLLHPDPYKRADLSDVYRLIPYASSIQIPTDLPPAVTPTKESKAVKTIDDSIAVLASDLRLTMSAPVLPITSFWLEQEKEAIDNPEVAPVNPQVELIEEASAELEHFSSIPDIQQKSVSPSDQKRNRSFFSMLSSFFQALTSNVIYYLSWLSRLWKKAGPSTD